MMKHQDYFKKVFRTVLITKPQPIHGRDKKYFYLLSWNIKQLFPERLQALILTFSSGAPVVMNYIVVFSTQPTQYYVASTM